MNRIDNQIYRYIPLYFLDYPAFIYGIIIFIFTGFSWPKLGLIFLLFTASSLWGACVTKAYSLYVYFRFFYFYLLRFRYCTYQRFCLEDFLPATVIDFLLKERTGIKLTKEPLGYICVVKRKRGQRGKPWPSGMTTFPLEVTPWYIMVPDNAEDFNAYQRFQLFHEIGHSTVHHKVMLERKINSPVQALLFLSVFTLISSHSVMYNLFVIILAVAWCVFIFRQKVKDIEYEKLADSFAILFLQDDERMEAIRHHRASLESLPENPDMVQRLKSLKIFEQSLTDSPGVPSLKALFNEYNLYAMYLSWPQWYVYMFILVSIILALRGLLVFSFLHIILIGLISVLLPSLTLLGLMFFERFSRERLELIMAKGEVPEEIVPAFYKRWEVLQLM